MKRMVYQFGCWMVVLLLQSPARGEELSCNPPSISAENLKQRLRHERGMAAFNQWRLIDVILKPCLRGGLADVSLLLAPPANWSSHQLAYHLQIDAQVDGASGGWIEGRESDFRKLAQSVRALEQNAESHEDVVRFLERYSPVQAKILALNGSGRLRIEFLSETKPSEANDRVPSLVFSDISKDGVVAYQLPRIDGLPVRRELLRVVEVLSSLHPRCRSSWVSAQRMDQPSSDGDSFYWKIQAELEGEDCPKSIARFVTMELKVLEGEPVRDKPSDPDKP